MLEIHPVLAGAFFFGLFGLVVVSAFLLHAVWGMRRRDRELATKEMGEIARLQAETGARIEAMRDLLAGRQAELQRGVNERLDSVSHRLNQSMTANREQTFESLQKISDRLAVIDNAQRNITDLASQMNALQNVLANKQQRGAFGQGRLEIIVRDGLPKDCYEFQCTLSNRSRPDCAVFLPDQRPLVIDAKFPLEAATAYREAKSEEERKHAATRLRQDFAKHVGDIAEKYLIPGETQELALMFVPSESVYMELHDGFDDIVQKAFRHCLSLAADARHPCHSADSARCAHARGRRQDPRRSRASHGRYRAPA
jgi:DNA recombination protein RmuC